MVIKYRTVVEIRRLFKEHFINRGHTYKESVPLTSTCDPTLLFNNSGMSPWKPYFHDYHNAPSRRLVTVQRCLRVGGKHNDIDEIGTSCYHHTSFEMCGNFSFSDYGIREAIHYAASFIVDTLKLEVDKISISLHDRLDVKSIWLDAIPDLSHDSFFYDEGNWWSAGEDGLCGPCTEMYYNTEWGPVEIWNIVNIRHTMTNKVLKDLPLSSIDTGMGLERLASIVQNVRSTYDIDTFSKMKGLVQCPDHLRNLTMDHIKTIILILVENVVPSSNGRGYIVRKLMRRLLSHGISLVDNIAIVYDCIKGDYDDLNILLPDHIDLCAREEDMFNTLLTKGDKLVKCLGPSLSCEKAFSLYETHGLDDNILRSLCKKYDIEFNSAAFYTYRTNKKVQSTNKLPSQRSIVSDRCALVRTETYETCSVVTDLYDSKWRPIVTTLSITASDLTHDVVYVGLDKTPFYTEAGGQVADNGWLCIKGDPIATTALMKDGYIVHKVTSDSFDKISIGDPVIAKIDRPRRLQIAQHHSGVHMLYGALQQVLGGKVIATSSRVDVDKANLSIESRTVLTPQQISDVESVIDRAIKEDIPTTSFFMPVHEAIEKGYVIMARDTYPSRVRIMQWADLSIEACCGTHVQSLGELGSLRIISCKKQSGTSVKITLVAGNAAAQLHQNYVDIIRQVTKELSCNSNEITSSVQRLQDIKSRSQQDISYLKNKLFVSECRSNMTTISNKAMYGVYSLDRSFLIQKMRSLSKNASHMIIALSYVKDDKNMATILYKGSSDIQLSKEEESVSRDSRTVHLSHSNDAYSDIVKLIVGNSNEVL